MRGEGCILLEVGVRLLKASSAIIVISAPSESDNTICLSHTSDGRYSTYTVQAQEATVSFHARDGNLVRLTGNGMYPIVGQWVWMEAPPYWSCQ
jgi:hypothetical protein